MTNANTLNTEGLRFERDTDGTVLIYTRHSDHILSAEAVAQLVDLINPPKRIVIADTGCGWVGVFDDETGELLWEGHEDRLAVYLEGQAGERLRIRRAWPGADALDDDQRRFLPTLPSEYRSES